MMEDQTFLPRYRKWIKRIRRDARTAMPERRRKKREEQRLRRRAKKTRER